MGITANSSIETNTTRRIPSSSFQLISALQHKFSINCISTKKRRTMALRIIYPAYQPMDLSPRSLFGDMGCSFHPMMRTRRRVVSSDFIDKVFSDMFSVPSYEACTKTKAQGSSSEDTFSKKMILRNYKPENIQVRVTADKKVIVEGKQELKEDKDGFQSYQLKEFKQTLGVPENVNIDELTSSFSDQGVLTITAPLLALSEPEKKDETQLKVTFDKKEDDKKKDSEKNDDESKKDEGSEASAGSQKKRE